MGIMLYCMVFDTFPFNGDSSSIIKDKIINSQFKVPRNTAVTEELIDLLNKMLNKDPTTRYTLSDIMNHKWMLLSDSAINLKVSLATQAIERRL
jgi:serine/threonine protein kinase